MNINEIKTSSYITKSNLPGADYVINPYVGCPHKCIYCYAEFMKRFTNHKEDWGEFIDVKRANKPVNTKDISENEIVLLGSVTDAYNPFENRYGLTRSILEELKGCKGRVEILTKSDLVLRDIDILKQFSNISVGISLNTLDDNFRKETEPRAASIDRRLKALKTLKEQGISTYLFMSPIFPEITNYKDIIEHTHEYFDYVCFENLNLRAAYKPRVLNFIHNNFPEYDNIYDKIYTKNNIEYWENLKNDIEQFCKSKNINYRMYFYHDQIKKNNNKETVDLSK